MENHPRTINFGLHPKQLQAINTPATELLYGGATRGGKSHMTRIALITWCSAIPGLQCFVFRRYYEDVISNHMPGRTGFRQLLHEPALTGDVSFTENTIRWNRLGSTITLGHCASDDAVQKHVGIAKHVLILEEACQILQRHALMLRTWVTMDEEMKASLPEQFKDMFPRIIYTTNPIGISVPFYKREFVKSHSIGEIWEEDGFKRQYIEARVEDNPSEDAEAVRGRVLGLKDPGLASALLEANWDAGVGDFFPQYSDKHAPEGHVLPNFEVPEHWYKFLTFDWGSSDPFAVIWWAISDGEPVTTPLGREVWAPRNSLVAYREWYGCQESDPSKGLEMSNVDIARGIVERTPEKTSGYVLTDSLPFQARGEKRGGKKYTIADVFAENGCPLVRGNCARIAGWAQIRDRLIGKDGHALIYFQESCSGCRDYIPALTRHKTKLEDAAEDGEATHICDCVRLACTARPLTKDKPADSSQAEFKGANITPSEIIKSMGLNKTHGRKYKR